MIFTKEASLKISILHLSDIHLKTTNNHIIGKRDKIFDAFKNDMFDSKHLFITITGDIAFSGLPEEYEHAESLLNYLKNAVLNYQPQCNVDFVIIPGNHDCDFSQKNKSRDIVISEVIKKPEIIDVGIIDLCTSPQVNFFIFSKKFHNESKMNMELCDKLINRFDFPLGDYSIGFNAFNMSWISKKKEKQSELVFPSDQISKLPSIKDNTITVSLIHHPFYWLNYQNIQSFKSNLEGVSNIILSGHEHTPSGSVNKKIGGKMPKEYIESGVLQDSNSEHNSAFSLISFDLKNNFQTIINYTWISSDKIYKSEIVHEECCLLEETNGLFHLKPDYMNKINSPVVKFLHPRKEDLKLTDLFVFQNLKRIRDNKTNIIINAKKIIDSPTSKNENKKILIFGDELSGKTSLAYILQIYLSNIGKIPLLIKGNNFNKYDNQNLSRHLEDAFKKQYDKTHLNKFHQSDRKKITIIIDEFEKCPLNSEYKAKLIDNLSKLYPNIIIFSHISLELETISDQNLNNAFSEYDLFRITEYGHILRDTLIEKWISLGQHETIQPSELHEKKIEISKMINITIGNNFIPRYPIYLITLLQAFETGSTSSLQGSSYGHYYHYLIVQSLGKTKVKQEDFDLYFSFLSHLAYFCFANNKYLIDEAEIDMFYQEFRAYTLIPENKAHNLSILLKSNLLTFENSSYFFTHSYIYYFFVSKYLADNIDDNTTKIIIGKITKRLYRTEFANIIIFLIHHSKKEFVIDNIISEAKKHFSNFSPITFQEDETTNLNQLIEGDLRFLLEDKTPRQTREENLRSKDSYEKKYPVQNDRDEAKFDEKIPFLDTFQKINLSQKMMEILGQIAKNYYGSLKGGTKYNLIDETIKLGMRTLNSFIKDMDKHKGALIDNMKYVIAKKSVVEPHKINSICNRIFFNFATLVACAFIIKTSKSIASRNLEPIYNSIYAVDNQISTKLINIASQLNFPDGLNVKDISDFYSKIYGNKMAESMLKLIVMNHLYMFDIHFRTKQQICSLLGIGEDKRDQALLLNKKDKF